MCLAKRGAQVALARTFSVSAENHVGFDVGGEEDGVGGMGVELCVLLRHILSLYYFSLLIF